MSYVIRIIFIKEGGLTLLCENMIVHKGIVRKFGKLVAEAERRAIAKMNDNRTETEPAITDRLFGELEAVFDAEGDDDDVKLRVRTLKDKGPNAAESEFGADFCAVFDISVDGFEITKGFLAQAKREGNGVNTEQTPRSATTAAFPHKKVLDELKDQTGKMLDVTPESYVVVYSEKGFVVVPASSIAEAKQDSALYGKSFPAFMKEVLMCFAGDKNLKAHDDASLRKMRDNLHSRDAILFQIHSVKRD